VIFKLHDFFQNGDGETSLFYRYADNSGPGGEIRGFSGVASIDDSE